MNRGLNMRTLIRTTLLMMATSISQSVAQRPVDPVSEVTRFDVSTGFRYIRANAPPGGCECFDLSGGYVSAAMQFNQWLGVEGQFSGSRATTIGPLDQDLTLKTYTIGPRATLHKGRLGLFGEALFGRANASDSYFPTGSSYSTSASSFAFSTGGGLSYDVTPRLAVRAIEGQYLRTGFPNGATNSQNHLVIGAGLVVRFRGRHAEAEAINVSAPNHLSSVSCSTRDEQITEGQAVQVSAIPSIQGSSRDVAYSWLTSGGTVQGSGRRITIDTRGLPPGEYIVTGRAMLSGDTGPSDCEVSFHVLSAPQFPSTPIPLALTATPIVVSIPAKVVDEHAFHQNVPDVLFDYDKWDIRSDGESTLKQAAAYLNAHPELHVMVGGYSDERGGTAYNIMLGLKRANAVRDRLLAAGIDPERVQVVSYGKEVQICSSASEQCWQLNRRAAFMIQK